ncbi:hypothetical protein RclHR1_17120003 [Rhizophagus clarus]|uniref:F-box domain-containing protein n=1 Tax=Rhizophagus clarus TaxID=94130 RepID=A0A2Z6QYA1_9GLOM|nr:hypothetical protein RclHR1_17120003 [Rhizophagus clarus]GES79786.1 hypothetical protein GLOIN_2v1496022 [Rhizophagus clarus]
MIVIPEILEMIFSYLYYPVFYPKVLLSCALVSKSWSNIALSFLWSKPFVYHDEENLHIKQVQQFRIFLSFLPDQLLSQVGLKNYSSNKRRNLNYNYLSFIKELYYLKLYEACLEFWKDEINMNNDMDYKIMEKYHQEISECTLCTLCTNSNSSYHPSKYFLKTKILPIIIELFNLILLKYDAKLKYFEFSLPKGKCFCDFIPLNYFTISSNLSFDTFSALQSFKCNGRYNFPYKKLFLELINYSKNIKEIKLENFDFLDENLDCIKKLIVSQKRLRNLELDFLIKQDFSDLFVSLKGNSNLHYVKISYCLFTKILPIKILSSCNNLKELIIESSEINEIEMNDSIVPIGSIHDSSIDSSIDSIGSKYSSIDYSIGSINNSSINSHKIYPFTTLKSFKLIKSILPKNIFYYIFSSGSNLERLIIKEMDLLIKYSNIIPLIYSNCNQLKFLEIGLTENTFEKILEILKNCNKLQELIIYDEHDDENNYYYNNNYYSYISIDHLSPGKVFVNMGKLISINLKKLIITTYYYFSVNEFKEFLFNYKINGNLKHLSINICGDKLSTLNLLKDYSNEINKNLIIKQWNTKNYDGMKVKFHQLFSVEFT